MPNAVFDVGASSQSKLPLSPLSDSLAWMAGHGVAWKRHGRPGAPGDAASNLRAGSGTGGAFGRILRAGNRERGIVGRNLCAPGEVSAANLAAAIDGTSGNSNGVATLGIASSDPPTQGEVQAIADKLDELISALRR